MGEQQRVGTGGALRGARALALITMTGCVLAAPSAVRAQEVTQASLAYERSTEASACPDEDEFREVVAERLGRDPFVAEAGTVVRVRLERDGRDFVGTVRLTDSAGDRAAARTLRARSCESVATSLATVIAVGLEPPPTAPEAVNVMDHAADVSEVESDATSIEPPAEEDPMHVPEIMPVAVASASTTVQVVVVPPAPLEAQPSPRRRRVLIVVGVLAVTGVVLAVGLSRTAGTNYADYTPTDVSVAALRFGP